MQAAIASSRQRRAWKLNLFFGQGLNWNQESINGLSVFKVTPVNYPASITTNVDRYFNEFSKQQTGGPVCYSDHSSISGGSLVRTVPIDVLARLGEGFEPFSPTALLFTTLLVDFLKSTFFIDNLRDLINIMSSEAPVIFERVIETFGIDRVMQHFGQDTNSSSYVFVKGRLADVVRNVLCRNLEEDIKRANRVPSTPNDYLLNFIWRNQDTLNSTAVPVVYSLRLGQSNNDARLSRIRNPSSLSLEARFSGSGLGARAGGFVPISIPKLKKVVSESSIPGLLLQLLYDPRAQVQVPPGARDDDHDDHPEPRQCLKAAILAAPDVILSPTGKQRVDATFPEHEISIDNARSLLSSKVKTIRLKEIKQNVHAHAMSSDEVMVGVFHHGPLKHCVLIDGRNDSGYITDPATSYKKGLVRSNRTLNKLEINRFRHLFVLKRVALSRKNRVRSAKSLKLPFLPSLKSDNDSKSAP